jgi:hypothetical protein
MIPNKCNKKKMMWNIFKNKMHVLTNISFFEMFYGVLCFTMCFLITLKTQGGFYCTGMHTPQNKAKMLSCSNLFMVTHIYLLFG